MGRGEPALASHCPHLLHSPAPQSPTEKQQPHLLAAWPQPVALARPGAGSTVPSPLLSPFSHQAVRKAPHRHLITDLRLTPAQDPSPHHAALQAAVSDSTSVCVSLALGFWGSLC